MPKKGKLQRQQRLLERLSKQVAAYDVEDNAALLACEEQHQKLLQRARSLGLPEPNWALHENNMFILKSQTMAPHKISLRKQLADLQRSISNYRKPVEVVQERSVFGPGFLPFKPLSPQELSETVEQSSSLNTKD